MNDSLKLINNIQIDESTDGFTEQYSENREAS